jgi:poly(3-hydroxybutyrate) depolymerase
MRSTSFARSALVAFLVVATCAISVLAQAPAAPDGRGPVPGRGRGSLPPDPRVQQRTYQFTDTNEALPYALFVSSKVRPDRKNPLIVALHGLGGSPNSLLRGNALDLAEAGGYILVGPMGYNPGGWYGSPVIGRRGAPPPQPPNLAELSEKDVLNVLDLVRREFNVDERRTYLMGHSMGGAGTFHLAVKHPEPWAAIAAIAPAAFRLQPSSLAAIPGMPVIVVHGDADTAVPVSLSRTWVEFMKGQKMTHRYLEIAGGDHGNVISTGMPDIFKFFAEHEPAARR